MENYNWKAGEVKLTYKRKHPNETRVFNAEETVKFARKLFGDAIEHRECFFAIGLNRANEIIAWMKVSEGGQSSTVVDHKMVLQFALLTNSAALIVAHNHPSGQTQPSEPDKRLTRSLSELCKHMDLTLLDHVILTEKSHFSFADHGLIS